MLPFHRDTSKLQAISSLKSKPFKVQELDRASLSTLRSSRLNRANGSRISPESNSPKSNSPSLLASRVVPGGGTLAAYRISVSGITYSGNTSFPSPNTSYSPVARFSLAGALVVEPRLRADNTTRRNGLNGREVTFIIGSDLSLSTAGTLRYSTHTWGHRHWGGLTTGRPALDTAFVRVINRRDRLTASVDPQWSRNDTSNFFAWRTGLTSAPKQILGSRVTIRFTNRGRRVAGSISFVGNGFIEPGAYAYTATFRGNLFR